jgi:arginase
VPASEEPIGREWGADLTIHVLHLDAHADLYDELEGDRTSHACVMARVMESGLAARMTQVGVRTLNPHQAQQAERYGVEIVDMRTWPPAAGWPRGKTFDGPVYLSLDLDVLDPAFAPGVSHPEPGGLSAREVIAIVQALEAPLIGADLVELNPSLDPAGLTARVAAKLLKEIAARMLAEVP